MFANGFTAKPQEKQVQEEAPQTMPLDDEFLHVDFLTHAHTIATNGDRPRDAHTADLVTSMLAVSRLSARIACELTWDQISADNKGILIARRDMGRIIRDYETQMERTIAGGEARHLHVHGPMPAPAVPNMSQLIDGGHSSAETVAHWTAAPMTTMLKDALLERLKVPLFTLLKEALHEPLLTSLADALYSDLLGQLRAPLHEGLAEPLIARVTPRVLEKAKGEMDELMRGYRTEVAHEADALEKRERMLKEREIACAREVAAAREGHRDGMSNPDLDSDDGDARDRARDRDVANMFYHEVALDIVRDRKISRDAERNSVIMEQAVDVDRDRTVTNRGGQRERTKRTRAK